MVGSSPVLSTEYGLGSTRILQRPSVLRDDTDLVFLETEELLDDTRILDLVNGCNPVMSSNYCM